MPPEFDDFANYDDKYYDMARGYCLLVHAELESYFEKICSAYIDVKVKKYTRTGEANDVILAIAFLFIQDSDSKSGSIFQSAINKMKKCKSDKVSERVNSFSASYKSVVKDNNGIKEADLKKLFIPTGLLDKVENKFDNFDSFGCDRGSIAHASTIPRMHNQIDPKIYYNKVCNDLLPSIEYIDNLVVQSESSLVEIDWDRY